MSIPLDINMLSDVEASKVAHLKAETELIERQEAVVTKYTLLANKLDIINKKINLAKRDEKIYERLYSVTKNLVYAGEKNTLDVTVIHNTLRVRKLDQQIYYFDKQIELLYIICKNFILRLRVYV